jgi:hypothetical protein
MVTQNVTQTPDEEESAPVGGRETAPRVSLDDPSVNRRRERRIYYREHFDKSGESMGWFPTLPLPSDPWHMTYYTRKGFKLWPPGKEPGQKEHDILQAQIKELEAKAEALKKSVEEDEASKSALESTVKELEEQASAMKTMVGPDKSGESLISCPVSGCTKVVKSYLGLARHMKEVHGVT